MAALTTGAKRALQAISEGKFSNASPSLLQGLALDGLIIDPAGKPRLTAVGAARVARINRCAGSMHRRTWHKGVSGPCQCGWCGGQIIEDPEGGWPYCEDCKGV